MSIDDDWLMSQEVDDAMKEAEARLCLETAAPDIEDGDIAAAASRALGIGCVDDADDDDASLAAEKLHDCAQYFVTQESTSTLEQEIDLPEDEDYGTDYSLTYESASTMIAQSLDTATAPTDELMSEAAWRVAWSSRKTPRARRARRARGAARGRHRRAHGRVPPPPCGAAAMRARWRAVACVEPGEEEAALEGRAPLLDGCGGGAIAGPGRVTAKSASALSARSAAPRAPRAAAAAGVAHRSFLAAARAKSASSARVAAAAAARAARRSRRRRARRCPQRTRRGTTRSAYGLGPARALCAAWRRRGRRRRLRVVGVLGLGAVRRAWTRRRARDALR